MSDMKGYAAQTKARRKKGDKAAMCKRALASKSISSIISSILGRLIQ